MESTNAFAVILALMVVGGFGYSFWLAAEAGRTWLFVVTLVAFWQFMSIIA